MMKRLATGLILGGLALPALAGALPKAEAVFPAQDDAEVRIGHLLFYDAVLSGARDLSCATCHLVRFGTADGLSLTIGDGAKGLGPDRILDPDNFPERRMPRNVPGMFNLGADNVDRIFFDGRLEADPYRSSGLRTPMEDDMATGFASPLSAQTMFPVLEQDEMAGHYSENDVADAVRRGLISQPGGAWDIIAKRVADLPEYRAKFDDLNGVGSPISFVDIADALAAFISFEWRADDSPFDRYLRTGAPLPAAATRGMDLFYGKANCDACHSGQFQSDMDFHAIAMVQIGPGFSPRFEESYTDIGRLRVTGKAEDIYKFRTPPLRNVADTAPYGHAGAYATLEGVIRHHLDPVAALYSYDRRQLVMSDLPGNNDFAVLDDEDEMAAIAAANELQPLELSDEEVSDIVAFLHTLTDETAAKGRLGIPDKVPGGAEVPR